MLEKNIHHSRQYLRFSTIGASFLLVFCSSGIFAQHPSFSNSKIYTVNDDIVKRFTGTLPDWVSSYVNRPSFVNESGKYIVLDNDDNVYVTGCSRGVQGSNDIVTIKYDGETGEQVWLSRFDSGKNECAHGLKIDNTGNVYVAAHSDNNMNGRDYLLIKYSGGTGQQLWTRRKRWGGTTSCYYHTLAGIELDNHGNAYLTGQVDTYTRCSNPIEVPFTHWYTISYKPNGDLRWERFERTPVSQEYAEPRALIVDNSNHLYITGEMGDDILTSKYNSTTGERQWVKRFDQSYNYNVPAPGNEKGHDLAVDSTGNVYVAATSYGIGLLIKYGPDYNEGVPLWVAETDSQNVRVPSDQGKAHVALNNKGNVYLALGNSQCGYRQSNDWFVFNFNQNTGRMDWKESGGFEYLKACLSDVGTDYDGNLFVTGSGYYLRNWPGEYAIEFGKRLELAGIEQNFSLESDPPEIITIKYDRETGGRLWIARHPNKGGHVEAEYATAIVVASPGSSLYVTGRKAIGEESDFITIKYRPYVDGESIRIHGQKFNFRDWIREPGSFKLSPLGKHEPIFVEQKNVFTQFECIHKPDELSPCSFSSQWKPTKIPDYMHKFYTILQRSLSLEGAGKGISKVFSSMLKDAPLGENYTEKLKTQGQEIISNTADKEISSPAVLENVLEIANAMELDWRVPKLSVQNIPATAVTAYNFKGVMWGIIRNVQTQGELNLKLVNGLPARAEAFEPGWPIASYKLEFTGALADDGYMDVSIHTGGAIFRKPRNAIHMLQWNGKYYQDITTHVDLKRRVITGRTKSFSPLVIVVTQ
ncbi:MAG: PQQ-binding-like beta-propeller repeat protein [Gammaproteobacteria bacterium]|nr:PQQ-binding-like beta-propeller repeat protein [Gammaproteobacteria bacterium]